MCKIKLIKTLKIKKYNKIAKILIKIFNKMWINKKYNKMDKKLIKKYNKISKIKNKTI